MAKLQNDPTQQHYVLAIMHLLHIKGIRWVPQMPISNPPPPSWIPTQLPKRYSVPIQVLKRLRMPPSCSCPIH
eukprot:12382510-Ditylum_brightwellii.AAC.1